jgi:SSS family solute:Na+ symporter
VGANSTLALVPLDYVEFFVFLAVLCLVGFFSGRGERKSSTDYFLAGRRLPWYAVGGSYVAANVSTEHFIGLVGATYILGMPTALAQWVTTLAEVVIVMLFVPFLIRANVVTVPQYLAARFGSAVRLAFALLTIFANITIFMAAVMYAGGLALSGFFGWPLLWCIIGTGAFAGVWAIYGGLNTVAWTGVFTAIVKIGGVTLLTILALKAMTPSGGIIVQRVLGARDIWHARMGMVMAGYAKLFLPLIIVLPGLILFAKHPEFMLGDWATANHRADGGFVVLVQEFFPAGLRGLLLAVLICAVQATVSSVVNATAAILTFDLYVPLINPAASEKQKVRFGIWASLAAIIAGIAMAIAISHMDSGIYQYMQTINALVAPPFAAILWVGLLWKRTNGAGGIAAIIAGFATGISLKLIGYFWAMPGWFYPFNNQAPVCLLVSVLACILGTLAWPGRTPGTQENPVTFWNSGETLAAGLGRHWYSSVVLWAGLSLVLTLAAIVIFSQLFFPTGAGS